jgi:hypothetical protein
LNTVFDSSEEFGVGDVNAIAFCAFQRKSSISPKTLDGAALLSGSIAITISLLLRDLRPVRGYG